MFLPWPSKICFHPVGGLSHPRPLTKQALWGIILPGRCSPDEARTMPPCPAPHEFWMLRGGADIAWGDFFIPYNHTEQWHQMSCLVFVGTWSNDINLVEWQIGAWHQYLLVAIFNENSLWSSIKLIKPSSSVKPNDRDGQFFLSFKRFLSVYQGYLANILALGLQLTRQICTADNGSSEKC